MMEIHLIYGVYEVGFTVGLDIGYKPHCLSKNPGVIFHYLPHRPRGLYSNVYGITEHNANEKQNRTYWNET